jgi:hypothetical protein
MAWLLLFQTLGHAKAVLRLWPLARLGPAYFGLAWLGPWPEAGPGTSLDRVIGSLTFSVLGFPWCWVWSLSSNPLSLSPNPSPSAFGSLQYIGIVVRGGNFDFFAVFGDWEWGSVDRAELAMALICRILSCATRDFSLWSIAGMCSMLWSGGSEFICNLLFSGEVVGWGQV